MKLTFSILFAAGALAAPRVTWSDLGKGAAYSFEEYLADFKKMYPESQMGYRRMIFERNLDIIRKHNADLSNTYYLHVNEFADVENEEFRKMTRGFAHGVHASLLGARNEAAPVDHDYIKSLPDSVDWRDKGVVTPVKNQGGCGSCWAFSATETLESALAIATGKLDVLSPQQLVSCAPNPDECGGTGGCAGSTQPLAFDYVKGAGGMTLESDYPYQGVTGTCKNSSIKPVMTIDGQVDLPTNNYTALMDAVANVGPVAISVDAGGIAWQLYGGGVYSGNCGSDIDHAVQLVGYGTEGTKDYWLVRNSWGSSWGVIHI